MKNLFPTVCHGQESLKNVDLGDKFLPLPNIGFSDVSVVQEEDCHMQAILISIMSLETWAIVYILNIFQKVGIVSTCLLLSKKCCLVTQ